LQSIAYAIEDVESNIKDPSLPEVYKKEWPKILIKLKEYEERINSF